jgi:alpha-beta hydrolase superfamily lysophospholipase
VGGRLSIAASLIAGGRAHHPIPLSDPNLFTDNPEGCQLIRADEKKLEYATARFLYQSARFDSQLRKVGPNRLQCPTTLVLAENDRIIRIVPTQAWAERVGGPNMNVVLMPGQAHTLEFAQDSEPFCKLLRQWGTSAVSGT